MEGSARAGPADSESEVSSINQAQQTWSSHATLSTLHTVMFTLPLLLHFHMEATKISDRSMRTKRAGRSSCLTPSSDRLLPLLTSVSHQQQDHLKLHGYLDPTDQYWTVELVLSCVSEKQSQEKASTFSVAQQLNFSGRHHIINITYI